MIQKPSKIQPALLGGLVMGLGSVIPGLNYVNFCCCGWAIVGGAVAAFLLKKRSPVLPISSGEGAGAGALAGVVASVIYLAIGVPLSLLQWNGVVDQMNQRSDSFSDAASREMFRQIVGTMQDHPVLISLAGWLVFTLIGVGAAAVGGVIGVALFEKRKGPGYPQQPPPPAGFMPGYGPPGQAPFGGTEPQS
jgi:hypothetical protein